LPQIFNSVMLLKKNFFSCDFNVILMCILSMHYSKASDNEPPRVGGSYQGLCQF
jgi:hypothetical protein